MTTAPTSLETLREQCAQVADEHLARIPGHNPDEQRNDLVAQGYGNAALNIAAAIRALPLPTPSTDGVVVPDDMKAWRGGRKAPDDWDGEAVQFRSGRIRYRERGVVWKLGWDHSYGTGDIIAYSSAAPSAPVVDQREPE